MHQFPIIRETSDFSGDCECPGGLKELHKIHRTLPVKIRDNSAEDMLQDEDGFGVNDEQTNGFIFDDLK